MEIPKPLPVLSHTPSEKGFPYIQTELFVFQSVPITSGPVTAHH